jgi:hypothetical protein
MLNPSILQVSFAGQTKIVLNFNDSPVGYDSSDALPGTTHLDWAILRFVLCKPVAFLSNLAVQSMNRSELCTHFLKSKICRCSYSSWHGGICATAYSSVSCPLQKLLGLWNFSCKLTFILQRVIHALFIRGMCLRLFSRPCLDVIQILSFFTLSPSHQFLADCMEY